MNERKAYTEWLLGVQLKQAIIQWIVRAGDCLVVGVRVLTLSLIPSDFLLSSHLPHTIQHQTCIEYMSVKFFIAKVNLGHLQP